MLSRNSLVCYVMVKNFNGGEKLKKVIVLGSHGTGKTVLSKHLVEELSKEFPRLKIKLFDGFAEAARKKGYKLNIFESQSQAIRAQLVVLRVYLDALRSSDADIGIIPDNMGRQFVYSNYNMMPEEFLGLLFDYFKEEVKGALVLYVPIEFKLPWDRHPSETFHKEIDKMIIDLLEDADVDYVTIKGTEMERVDKAMVTCRGFCES